MTVPVLSERDYQIRCGERLRRLIEVLNIPTAKQAADEMGISKQRLNNWLQGVAPIDTYRLYRWMRQRNLADSNWIMWGDWSALPARYSQAIEEEFRRQIAAEASSEAESA